MKLFILGWEIIVKELSAKADAMKEMGVPKKTIVNAFWKAFCRGLAEDPREAATTALTLALNETVLLSDKTPTSTKIIACVVDFLVGVVSFFHFCSVGEKALAEEIEVLKKMAEEAGKEEKEEEGENEEA